MLLLLLLLLNHLLLLLHHLLLLHYLLLERLQLLLHCLHRSLLMLNHLHQIPLQSLACWKADLDSAGEGRAERSRRGQRLLPVVATLGASLAHPVERLQLLLGWRSHLGQAQRLKGMGVARKPRSS